MITISPATLRRLRQLKQNCGTWEGARCLLPMSPKQRFGNIIPLQSEEQTACILWADTTAGTVRAMSIVEPDAGQEIIVRTLLQAIEHPHGNLPPGRPQKVLVNDRESHFYLRGILQELDIAVEFMEHLPLVEEIINHFCDTLEPPPPPVPHDLAPALYHQAGLLWKIAPWKKLEDHEVIEIVLNRWDTQSLYAIFMGKLGLERGVIFYHSLESLAQFRQSAAQDVEDLNLEETFLNQDCIFVLFNTAEEMPDGARQGIHSYGWQSTTHYPCFGVLHPLEGDRSFLYEEDALVVTAALEGLQLFLQAHPQILLSSSLPPVTATYTLESVPDSPSITLKTLVEFSQELLEMTEEDEDEDEEEDSEPLICTDTIPGNSLIRMLVVSWGALAQLRNHAVHKMLAEKPLPEKTDGLPVLLIQNSKPKALELIQEIDDREGLVGICFNPATDILGEECELGLIVTANEQFHIFGEFYKTDRERVEARKEWKKCCQLNKNKCAVLIAMGIRGDTKGNPKPQHILGYYEVELIPTETLGLGTLQAFPQV